MWSDSIHAPMFKRQFASILNRIDVPGLGSPPSMEYPAL
jgi:hypothetical protein